MSYASQVSGIFGKLGLELPDSPDGVEARSPIDGNFMLAIPAATEAELGAAVARAHSRFGSWRNVPAPQRGALVRAFGEKVRQHKPTLGRLVTIETGKILQEGLGEVQEVIDICEFALGLSRQLYGLSIATERPDHKLLETWHPLGVVGIISAFNFPMAVWAWNAALALVCGNTIVWKPSEKTALSALAINGLLLAAARELGVECDGLSEVVIGERDLGEALVVHPSVRLVSATGSTGMGRAVGEACAKRFKRALLELGGNNAAIVCPSADLKLAVRAVTFSAVGTAGQRCTSLRRLFVHSSNYAQVVKQLRAAYEGLPVGNPLNEGTLIGPLIDEGGYERMQAALQAAKAAGGTVHFGGRVDADHGGFYVRPALVEMPAQAGPMCDETFAPILYVLPYDSLDQAIEWNNAVSHGLSSAIFTRDLQEAEIFTSSRGSDCGICNVNIGTSGAEIGGAFGGEKDTGGGREAGSDAWKNYMRRATNTINYGTSLPLAQGVKFEI
ncbi:MAG TPA: aldehyde dehydrogenase family protein [Ramlibacter sp.]|nr:aldehyde dehydrogenase family protein [Ramlibacter sp.]